MVLHRQRMKIYDPDVTAGVLLILPRTTTQQQAADLNVTFDQVGRCPVNGRLGDDDRTLALLLHRQRCGPKPCSTCDRVVALQQRSAAS